MKSGMGRNRKAFGCRRNHSTEGFSLLELSVAIFLISMLCSLAMYTAMAIWRTGSLSTRLAEQSGMSSNIKRVLTDDIDRARTAKFAENALTLILVDGVQHRFAVNDRHQFVMNMQNGGTTVLADSVMSIFVEIGKTMVTVKVAFVSGEHTVVVADLLGGFDA